MLKKLRHFRIAPFIYVHTVYTIPTISNLLYIEGIGRHGYVMFPNFTLLSTGTTVFRHLIKITSVFLFIVSSKVAMIHLKKFTKLCDVL